MSDYISHDHEHDGIDRRGFLHCMAWAGTGLLWTISGGVLASKTLAQIAKAGDSLPSATDLSFLQISDSHIGFSKEANKDVRSEEHTSELQSHSDLVCRLLLEKKKNTLRDKQERIEYGKPQA